MSEQRRPRFQYGLRTLLMLFVVLGSSMAVFGAWGILAFAFIIGLAVYVNQAKSFRLSALALVLLFPFALVAINIIGVLIPLVLPAIAAARAANWYSIWPNIAALAVWLISVGVLLTAAVRGRAGRVTPLSTESPAELPSSKQ